jgi:avirulence protein
MTPLRDRYLFLAERLQHAESTSRENVQRQVRSGGQLGLHPFLRHERISRLELPDGGSLELTRLSAHTHLDGRPARVVSDHRGLRAGEMIHTSPDLVPAVMHVAQHRLAEIREGANDPIDAQLERLGGLHWLLAQAMPDLRGSAAKAELCVRALAVSVGIELPPFRDGIVPDLEAFLMDQDSFEQGYRALLDGPPLPR